MLAPDEKLKLSPKPYLSATARFASGADTPRDFLERCLADIAALEPKIGAFVHLNLDAARAAADQSTARWRDGPAALEDRRHADGHQGHHRDHRHADRKGLAAVRRLSAPNATARASPRCARPARSSSARPSPPNLPPTEPRGTRNPHDLRRTPGGSSSGSAAGVAAGMISAALGTQVIGSTIRPASYCGCIGFKVSLGALNRGGSYDGLSQSCDRRARRRRWRTPGRSPTRSRFAPAAIPDIPVCSDRRARRRRRKAAPRRVSRDRGLGGRVLGCQRGDGRRIGAAQGRRHRRDDAPIPWESRSGRSRDRAGASAVDADQRLGIALAAQHLSRRATRARSAASCWRGSSRPRP